MSLSRLDVEGLIAAVQVRPWLWDRFHKEYKDRNKTKRSWMEICLQINNDFDSLDKQEQHDFVKEVIKRWNNMRDSYRKCFRLKKEVGSSSDRQRSRDYVYGEQLKFLERVFEGASTELTIMSTPWENSLDEDDSGASSNFVTPSSPEPHPAMFDSPEFSSKSIPEVIQETFEGSGPSVKSSTSPKKRRLELQNRNHDLPDLTRQDYHLTFCKGFVPMIRDFNEDETLDFQVGVLNLIRSIRQRRLKSDSN